jgi:multidrug efflux pump
MAENPGLIGVDTDLKPTKPQLRVSIDRNRAGDLGISLAEIGRTLETLLGSRRVTTFIMAGREYDVIVEGERDEARTLSDLNDIYVRSTSSGELIPLANLVTLREEAGAGSLNRYNRVRGFTISAGLADGYKLGEALSTCARQSARSCLIPRPSITKVSRWNTYAPAAGSTLPSCWRCSWCTW